jgi:hypothetical protein
VQQTHNDAQRKQEKQKANPANNNVQKDSAKHVDPTDAFKTTVSGYGLPA